MANGGSMATFSVINKWLFRKAVINETRKAVYSKAVVAEMQWLWPCLRCGGVGISGGMA
jgi:hypothetical protein